jgi:hypothetical protein
MASEAINTAIETTYLNGCMDLPCLAWLKEVQLLTGHWLQQLRRIETTTFALQE